jgi:hypothetical protein
MEALMIATLSVDDHGCVIARTADGGEATVVWPRGYSTRGDDDSFEVVDAAGNSIADAGTTLNFGGGGVDDAEDGWGNVDCVVHPIWMAGTVSEP